VNIVAELFGVEISDYGVDGGKIKVETSVTAYWFDNRLSWNSTAHALPSITLDWEGVWVPPFQLETALDVSRGKVKVFANGMASWRISAQLFLQCDEKQVFSKNCTTALSEIRTDSRVNFSVGREMEILNEVLQTTSVEIVPSSVGMTNGIVQSPNIQVTEEYKLNTNSSRITDAPHEYDAYKHIVSLTIALDPLGSDCNICGDGRSNNLIEDGHIYEYPEEWLQRQPETKSFTCRQLDNLMKTFRAADVNCYIGRTAFEEPCCDDITSDHDCEKQIHDAIIADERGRVNTVTLPDPSNQQNDFGTGNRPRYNTNDTLDVKVSLDVAHLIDVDVTINSMTMEVSLELTWFDQDLSFEPFIGGCSHVTFRASLDSELTEIWVPQIELINLIDGPNDLPDAFASVRYDGKVTWRRTGILTGTCELNGIQDFPFDTSSCMLALGGTRDPTVDRVRYFFSEDISQSVQYSERIADNNFDFQEYRLRPNLTEVSYRNNSMSGFTREVIVYKFFFDRASDYYVVLFALPYILFAYLAIGVFFVDYSLGERLGYGSSILFVIVAQDISLLESTPVTNSLLLINEISLASKVIAVFAIFQSIIVLYIYTYHEFEEDEEDDNDNDVDDLLSSSDDEFEMEDALITTNNPSTENHQPEQNQSEEVTDDNPPIRGSIVASIFQRNMYCCLPVRWTLKKILHQKITVKDKRKTRKIKILRSIDLISVFICFVSYSLFILIEFRHQY